MNLRSSSVIALALTLSAVAVACTPDQATAPAAGTRDAVVGAPSFARPGASNPTLSFTVDTDASVTGIFSDGGGAYDNGTCGVFAVINLATSNALLDPDKDYKAGSSCGARRVFNLALPDREPVLDASYVTIGSTYSTVPAGLDFADIPEGATVDQRIGFMTTRATTGCDRIYFGYDAEDGTHPVSVTRTSAITWLVQNQPESNGAKCVTSGKGGTLTVVWTAPMPLRLTITQTSR